MSDTLRTCVAEYSWEFTPGPMLNGTFQPDRPGFRNYRINRGDDAATSPDFAAWPVPDGAPTDGLGLPLLLGDAMIWSVYNDADPGRHTNGSAGRTMPLGVEIQQSTFAFNRGDDGRTLASGLYFYRVKSADGSATGRIAILK